ncbi:Pectate lyase [Pseudobutyrivibrio sp. YE44]|uniref:pectate lyase family protein n=1 Tax=Pseudobutyrivibrio sp. YE44 TaxID=1520802 RepID=UPI00088075F0|nr:RICIN domain-containing protein [Pseudobutyrivibrio sp. YE44]SDB49264.1 Pectate lyase [Pseudobutyrivibrio sp. YE44]
MKTFKRAVSLFSMLVMTVASLIAMPVIDVRAAAVAPESGNIYYIKNKNSGLYLTVENDSSTAGANVIQATGTGSLGQRWILEKNSSTGNYRLHPATDMTGGLSLDVAYGSPKDETNIQIYSNNGQSAQNFAILSADSNQGYYIATEVSNFKSALNVYGARKYSGVNVQEYTYKGKNNEIWYFEQAPWPSNNGSSGSESSDPSPADTPSDTPSTNPSPAPSPQSPLSNNFPEEQLNFVNCQDGKLMTDGGSHGSALTSTESSSPSNRWILSYVSEGVYRIVNVKTGYCLTPNSSNVSDGVKITDSGILSSDNSQCWKIVAVKKDASNTALNYKIVSSNNTSLALTLSGESFKLSNYSGQASQCFRINPFGVEGFAGYSKDNSGHEKASVIGGVFGKTVTANSLGELQQYASGSTPYTIVIGSNISQGSLTKVNVGSNKTFIGSYGAHTLNNIHFRNIKASGNNIYKNINFTHSVNINNNDDIQMYISDGNNFWLDHCSWPGHDMNRDYNIHSNDTDKFLYVGLKANYVSVTDCFFGGHKYGLILGYPEENGRGTYNGYPCMTICNNYFKQTITRAPGLMRYGYFHCYNNYVYDFDLGYTPYTECNIYSEKNCFEKGNHKGAVVNDMDYQGRFTDNGSILSSSISNLKTAGTTNWRPSNNYGYQLKDANAAKSWAMSHAGAQNGTLTYPNN